MGLRRAATPLLLSLLLAAAHARREHDGNRKRGHGASGSAAALMGLPAEAGRFRDARFAQQESRGVFDFLKNMFGGSSQSSAPTATTGVASLGALGGSSAPTPAPTTMPQPSASLMGMIDRAVKANDWKPPSIRPTRRPFEALLPALERYRDSQYTLSGGVFVSMDQEQCHLMFLEHGVCPAPCARHIGDFLDPALFIGDKTLPAQLRPSVSKFVADTPEAQRADGTLPPAPPGVTSRDCLMKPAYELPERLSATAAPTAPDHCLCIDPCRRFKTCDECVANKQLSELPPPGLSPQEAEDYSPPNWSRAGSPYNCGWCQNRCVSGARDGPTVGGDQCLHWTYRMEQCKPPEVVGPPVKDGCANRRYSECFGGCKWVGWTRFTGYCADEAAAGVGSGQGSTDGGSDASAETTDA